jgi:hypothetical protein
MTQQFKALRNGQKCEAYKNLKGQWIIGGDKPYPNDAIMIVSKKGSSEAWFALKGCFLVFQDYCGDNEYDNIET